MSKSGSASAKGNYDVFISYSRRNRAFVERLADSLKQSGLAVWIDWDDIPLLAQWRDEIRRGILAANNFLIVLSPDSVSSGECSKEVDFAIANNKRLVPIVYKPVDPKDIRIELANVNWIFFKATDDFEQQLQNLVQSLNTDLDYIRTHTRLLSQANQWAEDHQRDESFLLRGLALESAEQWCLQTVHKQPSLTQQQREYITASRLAETQRQRREIRNQRIALGSISIGLVLAICLGGLAEIRRREAIEQNIEALAAASQANFALGDPFMALLEALRAATHLSPKAPQNQKSTVLSALEPAVRTIREANRLTHHEDWVYGIDFSRDGQLLASASLDGTISLWRTDGALVRSFQGTADQQIWDVNFSPNGEQLVVGGDGAAIEIWSVAGYLEATLSGHTDAVTRVRYSPNGQLLASTSFDNTAQIWRSNGTLLYVLEDHLDGVTSVSFSPDSSQLVTTSFDGQVRLWQADGRLLKTWMGHEEGIMDVAFSPDGMTLATAGIDRTVRLWQLDGSPVATLSGHADMVTAVSFSQTGELIASASDDRTVKIWQTDGTLVHTFEGHKAALRDVAFSPSGDQVASTGRDMSIKLWSLAKQDPFLTPLTGHQDLVSGVAFNPKTAEIISVSDDETLRIWSATGELSETVEVPGELMISVDVNSEGSLIISGSEDIKTGAGVVKLWDAAGRYRQIVGSHEAWIVQTLFSPDGQKIASASADGAIKVWSLEGELLQSFDHEESIFELDFSPDGAQLASAGFGEVRLWQLAAGSLLKSLPLASSVYGLDFHPNGQTLALGYDHRIGLWDLNTPGPSPIGTHNADVATVRFNPQGTQLASVSPDQTIRLWTAEGQPITTLGGHPAGLEDVQFSPDGTQLAATGSNGVIYLWDVTHLDLSRLFQAGCSWLENYLRNSAEARPQDQKMCGVEASSAATPEPIRHGAM